MAESVSLHTPTSRIFPRAALFVGRKFLAISATNDGTGDISWHNNVLKSKYRPASAATRSLRKRGVSACTTLCGVLHIHNSVHRFETDTL